MALNELLSAVDSTEVIDVPTTGELTPHTLSDSADFHYYLRGYDSQDDFLAHNTYQILSNTWRYITVDNAMVNSLDFVYDKPAFGYTVAATSYIVKINGVASRLDLPATTTRAGFEDNCRTLVAWCAARSYDQKPRFIGQAAWGRTGVVATILAPRITESFVVNGPLTSRVWTSFYAGLVIRNAFGPKVLWQNRDLPVNSQTPLIDEATLEAEAAAQTIEGEVQPNHNPSIDTILSRSSKVYQYLKTVRYGGGDDNDPGQTPGTGAGMWLTLIITLLSFFLTKKQTGSSTKAALVAGLAGAGTYYVQHETDWGKANLNFLDGPSTAADPAKPTGPGTPILGADGNPVQSPDGSGPLTTVTNGVKDVLTSWGGTGTAAVIGTTAVASSSQLKQYLPWLLIAGAALLILK